MCNVPFTVRRLLKNPGDLILDIHIISLDRIMNKHQKIFTRTGNTCCSSSLQTSGDFAKKAALKSKDTTCFNHRH